MLNDSESRYPVFTPANSKRKAPSPVITRVGERKLNSRQLKCSLESLSIPPSPTHTHSPSRNLTATVYSSITVNCSLGNLAGLRTPHNPFPSFPATVPVSLAFPKSCLHHSQSQAACSYVKNRQLPKQLWDHSVLNHYKTRNICEATTVIRGL